MTSEPSKIACTIGPDEGIRLFHGFRGSHSQYVEHEGEWRTIGRLIWAKFGQMIENLRKPSTVSIPRRTDYGRLLGLDRLGFGDSYVLFWDANEFLLDD